MKTAIFGGTFDPIHSAHLTIAREAAERFKLDQVLVIPAGSPPHKKAGTPYAPRFEMVKLACHGDSRLVPSDLESDQQRPSYSIHTIECVIAQQGTALTPPLYFIIGTDAFADLTTWHRWRDVAAAVDFIVVSRPGARIVAPPEARVHLLETLALDVSSSEIREQLGRGEMPVEVPPPVADYIRRNGLYKSGENG